MPLLDIANAMQSSPIRPHSPTTGDKRLAPYVESDDEERPATRRALPVPWSNLNALQFHPASVSFMQGLIAKLRLNTNQSAELKSFRELTFAEQMLTIQANLLSTRDRNVDKSHALTYFEVGTALSKNISKYTWSVLCNPKLDAYKMHSTAKNLVIAVLKHFPEGIPEGLWESPAAAGKLYTKLNYYLGQHRNKIRTQIENSVKPKESAKHTALPHLAEKIADKANVRCNKHFRARVAFLRAMFLQWTEDVALYRKSAMEPGPDQDEVEEPDDFWTYVDKYYEKIREEANGDCERLRRYFKKVTEADTRTHGVYSPLDDTVEDATAAEGWHTVVDDIIANHLIGGPHNTDILTAGTETADDNVVNGEEEEMQEDESA